MVMALMSLQLQLDEDLKTAMKAREATKVSVLRGLKAAVKNAAIEQGGAETQLTDTEVLAIVRKQLKQRQDSIEGFDKGNRPDLADKEREEVDILATYLPKEMSDHEVEKLVREAIAESGANSKAQMGSVMKIVQAKAAGRADGKRLSTEVQKQLG